ncbi:cell division protein ZapE [Sphingorhabdus sp.]|jgi:cell division protein ZapE|uniref:cell division protein ZapE n=1 Tax=Sphingorhabdus sp. TaxID=1902408 RepID=UPI003BAF0258|nr:AFG1 family ATPase [Sphingomonadales bacterium]MBK9431573.1 AFG1 family ATPase [Sphingomonadales bacterium]MBL0023224.1 AFG1 family ATPase [Sphingomonadales bacterium]
MTVEERYHALVAAGELKADPDQARAAVELARMQSALQAVPPRGSMLWKFFGKKPEPVRGLYMWGGVGRGKSMLMDLFFDSVQIGRKRRAHFHEFMLDIHARLNVERKKEIGDPIPPVVVALADEARLLCFDEMVVNNMADAAIMSRLFAGLIDAGVTVVTTSNRHPDDLYKNGLNRQLFLPFIDLIKAKLDILTLDGPTDYRRDRLGMAKTWLVPNGPEATKALSETFFHLTDYPPEDRAHVPSTEIDVGGARQMHVPKALKGVAVFSFKRLCAEARGAADYLAIARRFHTVIIVGIPVLGPHNRNEAARFVTLIDALYEYRVKLLASADAAPDALYPEGDGKFEFDRTVSRLIEMQSEEYLAQGHGVE